MEGSFRTLPVHPDDPWAWGPHSGMDDPFHTLPAYPDEDFDAGRTLPIEPREGFHCRPRDFDQGGRGPHGMPPRGGMPPFGGRRPPFGPPPRPMPDGQLLKARIAEAGLTELLEMSGRLMRHRPGAGSSRGQNLVLSILAGRESLSQRELQQMLGVQPGSMSEIVSKLERKGLLNREKGEDRRSNLLQITEAGRAAIQATQPEPEDELFSSLDASQQESLASLLRILLNDWASKLPHQPGPDAPIEV